MSGVDDLFKGLTEFNQGLGQLAAGNAIRNATSQVDALNQQNMADVQKRQSQQQISQSLAANLSAMGAPMQQVAQASNALAPNQPTTPDQAFAIAQQTGHPDDMKFAQDFQSFQLNKQKAQWAEEEKQIKLKDSLDAAKPDAADGKEQVMGAKQLQAFGKDVFNPSSRSTFGRYSNARDSADQIIRITGLPKNANDAQLVASLDKMSPPQVREIVGAADRLITNAAPTEFGQSHLMPSSKWQDLKKNLGDLTNDAVALNAGKQLLPILKMAYGNRDLIAQKEVQAVKDQADTNVYAQKHYPDKMDAVVKAAYRRAGIDPDASPAAAPATGQQASPAAPALDLSKFLIPAGQ